MELTNHHLLNRLLFTVTALFAVIHSTGAQCGPGRFSCGNHECVWNTQLCDGVPDCSNGLDELNCTRPTGCAEYEFDCGNNKCIADSFRCDGFSDCANGRDEENCPLRCSSVEFECDDHTCIPEDRLCDGEYDCRDRSDEKDCPSATKCSTQEFRCPDNICIPLHYVCNGYPECSDGADERECPCINKFQCLNGQCIENHLRCDRHIDCSDGSDEQYCPTEPPITSTEVPITIPPRPLPLTCPPRSRLCRSGDQCVYETQFCDGRLDCFDMSDETNCPTPGGRSCPLGQFRCENGPCISEDLRCNNQIDCPYDSSDELDCPTFRPSVPSGGLNLKTYPSSQEIKENFYKPDREVVFQCRDEGPLRARVHWIRPNGAPLPPGSRDINGRLEMPDIKVENSGTYICEAIGYPPTTPGAQVTVHLKVDPWVPLPTRPPTACELHQATCSNGDCIPKSAVCDGKYDCTDGSDETRCSDHGCEPNEMQCANKKCVSKTWRCDGDDDCGDGSDETECGTGPPGSPCRYHQFACHTGNQCIPKSYHCDMRSDCVDGTDEIGCALPVISKPPPPMVTLIVGETFEITCTAVGNPTPLINWRKNWGHIPPKCRTTSEGGFGRLICPNIQQEDQGAYSCEALNIKGVKFAVPDTILVVNNYNTSVCPPGYFNDEARSQSECIKCFCFGQTTQCRSADLFIYQFQPPFDSYKLLGVQVDPITRVVEVRDEPIYRGAQPQLTGVGRNGVHTQIAPYGELTQSNLVPYFAMPENYRGNQLKSYGGYLKYNVLHFNRGYDISGPDVIVTGNGYTLVHYSTHRPQYGVPEPMSVRFFEGEWMRQSQNAPEVMATREDIMMVLDRIDNILIKLQYNDGSLNSTLSDIEMDSAGAQHSVFGPASFVEECECPAGYTGESCEDCAEGYERRRTGPWLGKCYPMVRPCPPGTYGDPERNIPCQTCPCPLTNPGNQFARTCSLMPDGEVTCDCPLGYIGRRCEACAPGYSGNPMIPGDSCRPVEPTPSPGNCNPDGSLSLIEDEQGRCRCKDYVEGPYCNRCKANTFHLSPRNQFGCIACFCMGVTKQCSSSNWYRDQITSAFTSSRHEFTLVDSLNRDVSIEEGIELKQDSREIVYSNFPTSNVYYWSLPPRYLGNKISSYGGNLRYTLKYIPLPGGQSSRNSAADVELVSNNQISLLYYAKEQPQPTGSPQTFVVPLLEQYWQRSDGKQADREHLLMALADLSAIYIKATYTTNTRQAALISVSLDISTERRTGSGERALEVEQCRCPQGYRGLSCEDCDVGYTRSDEGIYLGLCEPCNCNGHSHECDPEKGTCYRCRDHTTGEHCEQCLPGYEGDPIRNIPCTPRNVPCSCDPRGSLSPECINGVCRCKTNVEGYNCDRCRSGTFGLNASLSEGCQVCFCSGVSNECSESDLYIQQIPSQILDNNHGFTLADQYGNKQISSGFTLNVERNEIGYTFRPSSSERWYWSLPSVFTGNKITSYGGLLELTQRYTQQPEASYVPDQDIIITGNRITIYWTNPIPQQPDYPNRISVSLSPKDKWQRYIPNQGPRPASREDILTVLANVDAILVRAQLSSDTVTSYISDVTLDTALEQYTRQPKAINVEVCKCPVGYRGTSCESCASGYYRDIFDTSVGPLGSCNRCPCNGNEEGCSLGPDNRVECHCLPGYSGPFCEQRSDTSTSRPTTEPIPTSKPVSLEVTINTPAIEIKEVGSSVTFNCTARSLRIPPEPYTIRWRKDGAPLPNNAVDLGSGILIITSLRVSDAGRYICEAYDSFSIVTKDVHLHVGTNPPTYPQVEVYPPYVEVSIGQMIEFMCRGTGNPRFDIVRLDGMPINRQYSFENGVFRIPYATKADEGQYQCIGTNSAGRAAATVEVSVRENPAPFIVVTVDPPSYNGNYGDTFTLRCKGDSYDQAIRWSKLNGNLPYNSRENNGILTVFNARPEDSGTYVCTVTGASSMGSKSVVVVISAGGGTYPTAQVSNERLTIAEGASAEIECITSGSPTPSVKWTRSDSEFESNIMQRGSILYIRDAQISDRGVYVCVARNDLGLAQASAFVEVTRLEVPVVSIQPQATQTVTVGNTATIQCRIDAGIPVPSLSWRRADGRPIGRNVEELPGGTLRFSRISVDEEGEYICTARNEAGTASASANIVVHTKPVVWTSPEEEIISRNKGDYLRLECHASGKPLPTVEWTKSGRRGYVPYARNDYDNSGYPGVSNVLRNVAVEEFQHLSSQDEGIYICIGSNDAGVTEKRIQLIIDSLPTRGDIVGEDPTVGRPRWKDNEPHLIPNIPHNRPAYPTPRYDENFTAPVGTRAELHCRINNIDDRDNNIFVSWIRPNNASLPENAYVDHGTLYIDNVQPSAAGEYNCVGLEGGNTIFILTAHLNVISPPRITLVPQRQVVKPGDNAFIQCSATGDQPIKITWSPMNRAFPSSVTIRNGYIQFNNIQLSDAGRYRCTAVNSAGEADAVADVIVEESIHQPLLTAENRQQVAPVGSSVTLRCIARNAGRENIRWFREHLPLPINSRVSGDVLQLFNVQREDEGRYFCETSVGSQSSSDYVDVQVTGPTTSSPPPMPTLSIFPSETRHHAGSNLQVNCQSSEPGVITTWSKLSGWLAGNVQNVGGALRISNLRPENSGTYRCEATGSQGPYHKDYNLEVIDNNNVKDQTPVQVKTAPRGASVMMECTTDLEQPVEYLWSKQGSSIPNYVDLHSRTIQLNDVDSGDAGVYICSADNGHRKIDVPTILVVTGIVPYFTQAPNSFIALPTLPESYVQFNLEISFKPENRDGIILYNGNSGNRENGDFISLILNNGMPEFHFNLGHNVTHVITNHYVSVGEWHTIKVHRNRKKVTLYVDGQGPYIGNAEGKYIGLDLSEPLYLGGVPNYNHISPHVGTSARFVGCISRLKIGYSYTDIMREAINKEGITTCETCSSNRCQNQGVCQEALSAEGYRCICPSGFSGPTCNKLKGEACSPYACGKGRCVDTENSFYCLCPLGYIGRRCEREITINEPAFQNDAYVAYPTPKTPRRLKVTMKVKPTSVNDGVLMYSGEDEEGHGDFASLAIKDQHLEFRFDAGNGPTVIRSSKKIKPNEWLVVTASRSSSEGRLIVNGEPPVIGRTPGNHKALNLLTRLYVGGYDKENVKINDGVGVFSGFTGCIADIKVSGLDIGITSSVEDSANVDDCSSVITDSIPHEPDYFNEIVTTSPPYSQQAGCSSNPCKNNGQCQPLSEVDYRCNCVNGYSGWNCENPPENLCDIHHCQNGGICVGNSTNYHCDCILGYTGIICDQHADLRNDVHFDGDGYLEFNKSYFTYNSESEDQFIGLELSTNSSEGLIFWHGQQPNQDGEGEDYIALGLVDGYLQFSFDLGSGPVFILNDLVRVDDGLRHSVILMRRENRGSIEIDNTHFRDGEAAGLTTTLNAEGNIYLGGAPNITLMTGSQFNKGFKGCIHQFELQDSKTLDLGSKALSGLNVKPCSRYEGIGYGGFSGNDLVN